MLQIRVSAKADATEDILQVLRAESTVSDIAVLTGASVRPPGDVVVADMAREVVNDVVDRLCDIGVQRDGIIQIEPVTTWISRPGFAAEQVTPGGGADSVVWASVIQRSYDDSESNWTYLSFMTLATLLAGIAIILDSQVLLIGAMILGPDFGPVAALGVALVRKRGNLLRFALVTLLFGFIVAIAITTIGALIARALGWISVADITGPRPGTAFIYAPDKWSFIVALIAGAAGALSLTSAKLGGLSGVFVSVTTIPAAANIALGLALGVSEDVWGSALQLVVNLAGLTLAGATTLAVQKHIWARFSPRRRRAASPHDR
jgi:uncharacterized hydrophobic protein (TIGR00271 family)